MSDLSPMPFIFAASVLYAISALLITDGANNHKGLYGWAISCGIISACISGVVLLLQTRGKGDIVERFKKVLALFFFVWWALGAGIGTFDGPFPTAGNGYFAAWIAFFASLKYAYGTHERLRDFTNRAANAMKDQPEDGMGVGYDQGDGGEAYA